MTAAVDEQVRYLIVRAGGSSDTRRPSHTAAP